MYVVFQISEINSKFTTALKQFVNIHLFLFASNVVVRRNLQPLDPANAGFFHFLPFDNKFCAGFPVVLPFLLSFVKPASARLYLFCYHFKHLLTWQ